MSINLKKQTVHTDKEIKPGMKLKHFYVLRTLTIVADEKGPAYTGNQLAYNEISLSDAKNEIKLGNAELLNPEQEGISKGERLRLVKWSDDGFPPIDLSKEIDHVLALIGAYRELKAENERLKQLEKDFYMNICRAYNSGKGNMMASVKDGESAFTSSHNYFINEFPAFKTNVP